MHSRVSKRRFLILPFMSLPVTTKFWIWDDLPAGLIFFFQFWNFSCFNFTWKRRLRTLNLCSLAAVRKETADRKLFSDVEYFFFAAGYTNPSVGSSQQCEDLIQWNSDHSLKSGTFHCKLHFLPRGSAFGVLQVSLLWKTSKRGGGPWVTGGMILCWGWPVSQPPVLCFFAPPLPEKEKTDFIEEPGVGCHSKRICFLFAESEIRPWGETASVFNTDGGGNQEGSRDRRSAAFLHPRGRGTGSFLMYFSVWHSVNRQLFELKRLVC